MRYNPPNRIFKKASEIRDLDIRPVFVSGDEIQLEFHSSQNGPNLVTVNDYGLWNCTCENYQFGKSGQYGEYCCKHIIAAIFFIGKYKGQLRGMVHDDDNLTQTTL